MADKWKITSFSGNEYPVSTDHGSL